MFLYSVVASNDGQALAAKSRWPWIEALGYLALSFFSRANNASFWAAVLVSFGVLPFAANPPT